ncbi:MAG: hypothetical protein LBR58_11365 [Propionibacteriaceae bacterium]|jgi:hypothetical protein|nr:hypothetical protein [Propionibacteriaceae bacterium]
MTKRIIAAALTSLALVLTGCAPTPAASPSDTPTAAPIPEPTQTALEQGVWLPVSGSPIATWYPAVVSLGDRFLVFGGHTEDLGGLVEPDKDFQADGAAVFDPNTQTWTQAAALPGPLTWVEHAQQVGDAVYALVDDGSRHYALYRYDTLGNTWSTVSLPAAFADIDSIDTRLLVDGERLLLTRDCDSAERVGEEWSALPEIPHGDDEQCGLQFLAASDSQRYLAAQVGVELESQAGWYVYDGSRWREADGEELYSGIDFDKKTAYELQLTIAETGKWRVEKAETALVAGTPALPAYLTTVWIGDEETALLLVGKQDGKYLVVDTAKYVDGYPEKEWRDASSAVGSGSLLIWDAAQPLQYVYA